MQPDGNDLRLLGELGLLAASRGLHHEGELIAAALAAWRPDNAIAGIIRAIAAMSRGQNDEAVRILRDDALRAEPDSAEAQALLGLALENAGYRHAASTVLAPLADQAGAGAGELARAVLGARRPPSGTA